MLADKAGVIREGVDQLPSDHPRVDRSCSKAAEFMYAGRVLLRATVQFEVGFNSGDHEALRNTWGLPHSMGRLFASTDKLRQSRSAN